MFAGKKILITAGPTYEPIDPVRFLGNRSSGKMGKALAEAFADERADVVLVKGPVKMEIENENIRIVEVNTAEEMYLACMDEFLDAQFIIMAAAVADYTPKEVFTSKKKKEEGDWIIELKRTKDILAEMGKRKKDDQLLVGFALESENESENAKNKLKRKNVDMIVMNSLRNEGAGFQYDTNKVTIFDKYGNINKFDLKPKKEVAADILKSIVDYVSVPKG